MTKPNALNQQYPRSYADRVRLSYTTTAGQRVSVAGLLPAAAGQIRQAQEALGSYNFAQE